MIPGNIPNGVLSNGQSVADQIGAQQQELQKRRQQQQEINKTIGNGIASGNYGDALPPNSY